MPQRIRSVDGIGSSQIRGKKEKEKHAKVLTCESTIENKIAHRMYFPYSMPPISSSDNGSALLA